jgi:putative chitinase
MAITIATLIAAGLAPTQARTFAAPLASACEEFDLNTALRQAGLVGQCRIESADFAHLEESLFYNRPERIMEIFPSRVRSLADAQTLVRNPQKLGNRVYAGRLGNGDEASGDGWRFRGRGPIQITGRTNYTDLGTTLGGRSAEAVAELMTDDPIEWACRSAAWFFTSRGCSAMADASNWDAITRAVNGPRMLESARRRQYCQQALEALR